MKFSYSSIITAAPDGDDFYLIRRPEIPVTIVGANGQITLLGLVDTGADNTIFPKSVADHLQIPLEATEGSGASAFGGQRIELLSGEAILTLKSDDEPELAWPARVCFFDFPSAEEECVILGHASFLELFTATFDGENSELTLIANSFLTAS